MHPLSLFPSLFSYPLLAYCILRMIVAVNMFALVKKHWGTPTVWLAIPQALAGLFVLIGLYTQPALILVILCMIAESMVSKSLDCKDKMLISIVALVAFSLLFLGAGAFAFDMPL